jgi:hypothetical protein
MQQPATIAQPDPKADRSATLILTALDREALYTVAGIKPMSTGFWTGRFAVDNATQESLDEVRRVRRSLRDMCSWPLYSDVMSFATAWDGQRSMEAYVVHVPLLGETIARYDIFAKHGLTSCSHPAEVLAVVERMPRADRFAAYGHLFGYPDHAVQFFVQADEQAQALPVGPEGKREIVPRDFFAIPTFSGATGRFTFAVPKGHVALPEDKALRSASERVLLFYRERRAKFVSTEQPSNTDALRLLDAMKDAHTR